MNVLIRKEKAEDIDDIFKLIETAFQNQPYATHTEQFIVNALRASSELTLSLVATEQQKIIGQVAISPVTISSGATDWYGLGPISVLPERQHQGIGSLLMQAALNKLKQINAQGCILVGDPVFYHRFGFHTCPDLHYPNIAQEYVQVASFTEALPKGVVMFSEAFNATE
nr:N-acetyltransferase [Acinetobacter sp. Marseille-Q1620]